MEKLLLKRLKITINTKKSKITLIFYKAVSLGFNFRGKIRFYVVKWPLNQKVKKEFLMSLKNWKKNFKKRLNA